MKLSYCFIVILIFLGLSASAQQTHEEVIAAEWMYRPYHFEMYQS